MPKLTPATVLFRQSLDIYSSRFRTFFGISAIPAALLVLSVLFFLSKGNLALFALGFLTSIASVVFSFLAYLALMYAVTRESRVFEAYRFALSKFFSYAWIGFLNTLIVLGGMILFVVPGIIFSIWFMFAPFVLVYEETRGMAALLKSKAYVRGYWGAVWWRIIFPTLIVLIVFFTTVLVISAITGSFILSEDKKGGFDAVSTILQALFQAFVAPFMVVYMYLLYRELTSKKAATLALQPPEKKGWFIAAGIFGGIALPAIILATILVPLFLNQLRSNLETPYPPNNAPGSTTTSNFETK